MIETFQVLVPAPAGEEKRKVYVYLPKKIGEERFPVLYLFDGQTAFFDKTAPFGDSLQLGKLLDARKARLIVVAVECDKKNRLSEYSPFPFTSKFGSSEGKGEAFLRWLTEELKPFVDKTYPTLEGREHTFLMGSSMGGLMTIYGLAAFPEVFGGGAALSPSLWVDPAGCEKLLLSIPEHTKVYLDYGEGELKNHGVQQAALARAVRALLKRGMPFSYRLVEGARHNERAWRERMPAVLECLSLL